MTSESETCKTNEFLRRRKLRLQQVREQSKDIAKKLRQRAKGEKLQHIEELKNNKEKEYLKHQEKLIRRLEHLYSQGVKSVGASHNTASALKQDVLQTSDKEDLSKVRGKEAAAILRKKKQEKLDQQKRLLDRKLLARETANEISREKSSIVASKVIAKSGTRNIPVQSSNSGVGENKEKDVKDTSMSLTKNDMATQWDSGELPNEWESNIPLLSLPKEDRESLKESDNVAESKSERSKKFDLFALSSEMPSSLRGGLVNVSEERANVKSSLTMVSEYLQSRALRLREPDLPKKQVLGDDLHSLKQTILNTRSSKLEGNNTTIKNVCQVVDEQVVPVPSWEAETTCKFCSHSMSHHSDYSKCRQFAVTSSEINKIFSSIGCEIADVQPSPVLRGSSPFRRNKKIQSINRNKARKNFDKSVASSDAETMAHKKSCVSMYNHSTKNSKDIPLSDLDLVVRDYEKEEDAYTQALKERSQNKAKDKEYIEKLQDMRSKVAMTKQTVEREYNDTMSFLRSLPQGKCSKHLRISHMDQTRQQSLKDKHQLKLQSAYNKIERESRKHETSSKSKTGSKRTNSKSPVEDFETRDFQYSWMPVPESDGNLAIHTIPTTLKEGKSGNTVKFSKVDSYHEYRSRHKHTPPTKDTGEERQPRKKSVEAVLIENESETMDLNSSSSDTSSIENLNVQKTRDGRSKNCVSDEENVVIYKILKSKECKKKKERRRLKLIDDVAKVLTAMDKRKIKNDDNNNHGDAPSTLPITDTNTAIPLDQINEGVYKLVNEKGLVYNVTSCFTANVEMWQTKDERKPWWDNIASLCFNDTTVVDGDVDQNHKKSGLCKKIKSVKKSLVTDNCVEPGDKEETLPRNGTEFLVCDVSSSRSIKSRISASTEANPSVATSTSSFKTAATNAKNVALDGDSIKILDDNGQETGKFYIGASGYLKDDAYEITIQLKKKEATSKDENGKSVTGLDDIPNSKKTVEAVRVSKISDNLITEPVHINDALNKSESCKADFVESEPILSISQEALLNPICSEGKTLFDNNGPNTGRNQQNMCTDSNKNVEDKSSKKFVDIGVYTDSQLSFAVPSDFPKTDVTPRPATSTYTQTTLNSPNTRPVYIHMSSSTSTAYMSPPEMILPKCLRHKYKEINAYSSHSGYEIIGHRECDQNAKCTCKRCVLYDNDTMNKTKTKDCLRKISTPPNTARNCLNTSLDNNVYKESSRKKHKKCRKCNSRATSSTDVNFSGPKVTRSNKLSTNDLVTLLPSSASKSNDINERTRKSNLDPTVKKYVNKLLELNSNSLKAIEIASQECSSISTPGSSVIDVTNNISGENTNINNKISLQQIKMILKQKLLEESVEEKKYRGITRGITHVCKNKYPTNGLSKLPKMKRSVHKVKSLNISRKMLKSKKPSAAIHKTRYSCSTSSPSPAATMFVKKSPSGAKIISGNKRIRSKSSPTPRFADKIESTNDNTGSDISDQRSLYKSSVSKKTEDKRSDPVKFDKKDTRKDNDYILALHKAVITDSEANINSQTRTDIPTNTSTQTSQDFDSEINLIKMAEGKIQNMEKIADLTEKCTKRLSNLAKILDEVRKNKSLAYSHISTSDTASDTEPKSDKDKNIGETPDVDLSTAVEKAPILQMNNSLGVTSLPKNDKIENSEYISFLKDIPKPDEYKFSTTPVETEKFQTTAFSVNQPFNKNRTKPPPALNRISLKHGHDIIPHELSTVVEVDSPMSVKLKNQPSQGDVLDTSNHNNTSKITKNVEDVETDVRLNPDLLQNNNSLQSKQPALNNRPSDDTKVQMMDLKQFNDVMLKPFITLQEYAKQCNIGILDEGSNMDDNARDDVANDEFSSLHSDGSLPDVIAELLKRNIITEPFKFESISNINSTTVSSESTLSVLAPSKVRNNKRKAGVLFKNKENISETSDSLSISSNPDLENAFKKLGMGWASSTLKKTKERLALSSSSNTSSSSLSQFKAKNNLNSQQIPALVTDSMLSASKTRKKQDQENMTSSAKNAEQQTLMTSMTVKEFLTNELAKKITFTNKSYRNDTDEEFVSLLETQIPEEMKNSSQNLNEERSVGSLPSGSNNRARTSTPVQIFKSMTYHSSSSSNLSNGLFSNADDLSSVKVTSNSMPNHSTSDKGELTIPNCSLKVRKGASDCSKSD